MTEQSSLFPFHGTVCVLYLKI